MADKKINTRIQLKHDIEANWNQATGFTPRLGEVIIYSPDENHAYSRIKIGDGTTSVTSLPFVKTDLSDILNSSDLQAIEALTGTSGLLKKTAANTWTLDTNSYSTTSHNHDSIYLKLDGSNNMTADINIIAGDTDKFVNFWYNTNKKAGASWRIGDLGSGSGDTNYFVIQSGTSDSTDTTWTNALRIGMNTHNVYIPSTTASTSTLTGALTIAGGLGVAGDIYTTNLHGNLEITAHTNTTNGTKSYYPWFSTTTSGNLTAKAHSAFYLYEHVENTRISQMDMCIGKYDIKGTLTLWDGSDHWANINISNLSANRSYIFPDKSGTIALTSDLPTWSSLGGGDSGKHANSYFVKAISDSVDNTIVRFDGASGQVQKSNIKIDDKGNMEFINAFKLYSTKIPSHTHTSTGAWWKIARVGSYFNFNIYITGSWNTNAPSVCTVNITNRNGVVKITQLSGFAGPMCQSIKLGQVSTDSWDVLIYNTGSSTANASSGTQIFHFLGYGNIVLYEPTSPDTTTYSTEETLTLETLSGISLTSTNYTNYAVAKTEGVTAITWDSTNNKLIKTINETDTDVVTLATIKTALGNMPPASHTHGNITNQGTLDNANRIVWTSSDKKIYAGYHYASTDRIAINSAISPSYNLYVNGTTYFNGNSVVNGILQATTYEGLILKLHQGAAADPSLTSNARIEFDYTGGQPVVISYTPNDSYRNPAGLKIMGGANATPAWLEVEGKIYAAGFSGSGASLTSLNASNISSGTLAIDRIANSSITNAKLTNSSITIGASSVSLGGTLSTITGPLTVNTSRDSAKALSIKGNTESAKLWMSDTTFFIQVNNDDASVLTRIELQASDTINNHEGASASTSSVQFKGQNNKSEVIADNFTGLASKATADASGNTITSTYAPLASPALTGIPTAPTAANGTSTTQIATTAFVNNTLAYINSMQFKGTIGTGGTITALPATHNAGDTYRVITAETYAGKYCEVGTLIICVKDGTTAADADWTSVETNEDGSVIGPSSSTTNQIPVFSSNTGRIITNSTATVNENGDITISTSSSNNIGYYIQNTNINRKLSLRIGASSGQGGLYDNTNGKWIVYSETNGNVILNGNANTATAFSSVALVELTGDTTGSVSSTKGWRIATTTNFLSGTQETSAAITTSPGTGKIKYSYNVNNGTAGLFSVNNNANSIITLNRHTGNYNSQLGFSSNGNIYYRSFDNSALNTTTAWKQFAFIDSNVASATIASTANALANLYTSSDRPTDANIAHVANGGVVHFKAASRMVSNKPMADGHILHFHWDIGAWNSQLYIPVYAGHSMQYRASSAEGIWGSWKTILDNENISPSITITAGDNSNAPKINLTVGGVSGTAQSITTASTSIYGVTKLSGPANSTTLAATAKSVYDLDAKINNYLGLAFNTATVITPSSDSDTTLDTLKTAGNYYITESSTMKKFTNRPWDDSGGRIFILDGYINDARYKTELAIGAAEGSMYFRRSDQNGAWKTWYQLVYADPSNRGSSSKPVYVASTGKLTPGSTYAGGTAVTLNSVSKAANTASFYAPASSGNAGEILISGGSNTAPNWETKLKAGLIYDWTATIQGQTWSRICYVPHSNSATGTSLLLNICGTRSSVVYNYTLIINVHHKEYGDCHINVLQGNSYSSVKIRGVYNSSGDVYIELYDDANSIASNATQLVSCNMLILTKGTTEPTLYTTFTDGTTRPSDNFRERVITPEKEGGFQTSGYYIGNGSKLTNLNGANITNGIISSTHLPIATSEEFGIVKTGSGLTNTDGLIALDTSGTWTGEASKLTCPSITTQASIASSGTRSYQGSGSTWTGSIASMRYAGILQVCGGYTRGWQIWASRGDNNSESLHWRNPNTAATAWNTERIIIDSGNYTTYTVKQDGTGASGSWEISAAALTQISKSTENDCMPTEASQMQSFRVSVDNTGLNNDGYILGFTGSTADKYGAQLFIDADPTHTMALRQRDSSGVWQAWKKIPMGDGTNASGTWGISITGGATRLSQTSITSLSSFTHSTNLIYSAAAGDNTVTDKPDGVDGFGVLSYKTASGWYGQILTSANKQTGIYWRTGTTLSGGWKKLLDATNYTDYTVTKTGTGASGSWGISITGNANTATTASKLSNTSAIGAADRPVYFTADGVPAQTTYRMVGTNATATTGITYSENLNTGIWYVNGIPTTTNPANPGNNIIDGAMYVNKYSNDQIHEIYGDYRTGQIAVRGKNGGAWQAWRKILDTGNTTAPSTTPTLDWDTESTVFTLNGTAIKVKTMEKPTYSDVGAAKADHTHGNITNDGKVVTSISLAQNDYIIVGDSDANGKIGAGPAFCPAIESTTTSSRFLREDGSWAAAIVTKVAIAASDATSTGNFPIVYAASDTSVTAAQEGTLKKSTNSLYFQPSTGTLTATKFVGNLTGNVSTTNNNTLTINSDYTMYLNSANNTSIIFTKNGTSNEMARFDTSGNFVPKLESNYSIGTENNKWNAIYAKTITALTYKITSNATITYNSTSGCVEIVV